MNMTRCPKCGVDNPDISAYCSSCGASLHSNADETEPVIEEIGSSKPDVYQIPTKHTFTGKGIAIAVVAILIVAGIGYYVADNYGHHAYVAMYVTSTHVTENVDVQFIINDEVVMTFTDLEPGNTCYNTTYFRYDFSLFDDSEIITVKAISTGGGLGSTSDSEEIIVQNGQYYSVDLFV